VHGPAFAEVAKAKSDGLTAKDGGVHDWTTKGALQCKAIDDALFTLQVGQMSSILDSGPSFHIIRVLERTDAGRKPFTDVQADIRESTQGATVSERSREVSDEASSGRAPSGLCLPGTFPQKCCWGGKRMIRSRGRLSKALFRLGARLAPRHGRRRLGARATFVLVTLFW